MVLNVWEGLHSRCLCSDGSVHDSIYCLFKSDEECQNVHSMDPYNMFTWRDQRFCVKRVEDWKWVGSKKCPDDMLQWSQGFCLP